MTRKHSFLLIEIITASILSAIIMAICLSCFILLKQYTHSPLLTKEYAECQKRTSLRRILSNINFSGKPKVFRVDPETKSMIFLFDNKQATEPLLSNNILGMLYIDDKKGLLFVMRSLPNMTKENEVVEKAYVLWPDATDISWKFAFQENDKKNSPTIAEASNEKGWVVNTWDPLWTKPPSIIQAEIFEKTTKTIVTTIVSSHVGEVQITG